jgi:branched-chain amino acid transport system permease protein
VRKHNLSRPHTGLVVGIALLCALPFFLRDYYIGVVTELLIFIPLAVSFRLILTTGGWNLAHYVVMGSGAYFSAIMVKDFGWPFWAALPVAGLVTALVGFVLSFPLSKMREFAYLIGSYAMGESIRLAWNRLDYPFGGPGGITDIPRPSSWSIPGLPTIDFSGFVPYYFLVMVVMLVSLFIMYRIDRSLLGDTFKSIYSQDILAENVGIEIVAHKRLAIVIGSFFAGLSGVLYGHYNGAIDPDVFSLGPLIILLAWLAVGGTRTFTGPIIGTVFFFLLAEGLRPLGAWRPLVYGCVLIGVLLFMPHGLEGLPAMVSPWVKRLRRRIRRE